MLVAASPKACGEAGAGIRFRLNLMNLLSRTALRPVCLAAACIFTSASTAQEQRPIVITGTLLPRSLGSEIAATSVLTRDELERAGVTDLVSALRLLGSAQVEQLGGTGTTTSVRLRGADTRDTLVLIDGVPLNDVTTGQASLQQIPVEIIERIEVVRGNLSALYGGNATGGVIQVFTRRGSEQWQAQLKAGAGTRRTASASASIAGGQGPLRGRLTIGGERTDGFSAANPALAPNANPDDDGNRRRHATLALDAAMTLEHSLGADLRVLRGNAEYDSPSSFSAATDTHEQYVLQRGATLRGRHRFDAWTLAWRASDDDEIRRDFGSSAFGPFSFGNTLHNRALALDLNGAVAEGWAVQAGAEKLAQASDNTTYTTNTRDIDVLKLGVQHDGAWGGLQAHVRHDRTSDFGSATTGLLGGQWRFSPQLSVIASVSNSFTPPTLDFLFFDCSPFGFACSNPNLRPEKSRNVDLALQWQSEQTLLRATLFDVRYRDKIANNAMFVPDNILRAKNHGVELAARTSVGPWQLAGEATLQRPVNADSGERLQRRPRGQLALRAHYDAGAYGVGAALRHVGARPDFAAYVPFPADNRVTLAAYTVVDLNARWQIAPHWTLQATIENLFDRSYEPAAGYNGRPRGALVSVAWQLR